MVTELTATDLSQFVTEHADTPLKRDLLLFWKKYPYARFTSGIVARAVDRNRRIDVEIALECFVQAELLEKYTQQGLPFYRLTTVDSPKRECVLNLPARRPGPRPLHAAGQEVRLESSWQGSLRGVVSHVS